MTWDEELAGKLIMKARESWFAEAEAADAAQAADAGASAESAAVKEKAGDTGAAGVA